MTNKLVSNVRGCPEVKKSHLKSGRKSKAGRKASVPSCHIPSDVDAAVKEALAIHSHLIQVEKIAKKPAGKDWQDGERAVGEANEKIYSEQLRVFNQLWPMAELGAPTRVNESPQIQYSVYENNGCHMQGKGRKKPTLSEKLELLRKSAPSELAKEALFVLAACMGSRKQMCWLDSHQDEKPNRGRFAFALAETNVTWRMSFLERPQGVIPASLLLTIRTTMREALDGFDCDGPLKEMPSRINAKYEFAWQALMDNDALGTEDGRIVDERVNVRELVSDSTLGELIHKDQPVIAVDSYVALAPQHVASAEGLNKVVCAEFEILLRRAKEQKIPLILQLGGNNPHLLAKKVYMRPAFAKYGLKCGYIRWRSGPRASWGKEQPSSDRSCIALMIP